MQAETDKFRQAAHLVQDYYFSIENRLIPDAPERKIISIAQLTEEGKINEEEVPPISDKAEPTEEVPEPVETFPRLDKYLAIALEA